MYGLLFVWRIVSRWLGFSGDDCALWAVRRDGTLEQRRVSAEDFAKRASIRHRDVARRRHEKIAKPANPTRPASYFPRVRTYMARIAAKFYDVFSARSPRADHPETESRLDRSPHDTCDSPKSSV